MEEPFTLRELAPRRRRRGPPAVVAVAAGISLLAAGLAGWQLTRPGPDTLRVAVFASPTPSPSPPPSVALFDERTACIGLVPVLQDGADILGQLDGDHTGKLVDRAALDQVIARLETLLPLVPDTMRSDTNAVLTGMTQIRRWTNGEGVTINTQWLADAAIAIGQRCLAYAD